MADGAKVEAGHVVRLEGRLDLLQQQVVELLRRLGVVARQQTEEGANLGAKASRAQSEVVVDQLAKERRRAEDGLVARGVGEGLKGGEKVLDKKLLIF